MRTLILFIIQVMLLLFAIVYKKTASDKKDHPRNKKLKSEKISYAKDIVPVLQMHCYSCHSSKHAEGALDFSNYEHVYYSVISKTLVDSTGNFYKCPDRDFDKAISADSHSVTLVRRWIDQGAIMN